MLKLDLPGIWKLVLQFNGTRTIGETLDTGEVLMRPLSCRMARLTRTLKLHRLPPIARAIQQQLSKLRKQQHIDYGRN